MSNYPYNHLGQRIVRPKLKGVSKKLFLSNSLALDDYEFELLKRNTEGWTVEIGIVGPRRILYRVDPEEYCGNLAETIARVYGGGDYVVRLLNEKRRYHKTFYLPVDFQRRGEVYLDFNDPILIEGHSGFSGW